MPAQVAASSWTRTITCDNANAVKPFGAIDTPDQGGTVSGTTYTNFGWALTPQPNMIPTDGSSAEAPAIGHWAWLAAGLPLEVPGYEMAAWTGVLAPTGTPAAVVSTQTARSCA